jgi:ribose transport system permease protein
MMLVILLGHIDLSAPRVVTTGAMMASAATAYGPMGEALAIPFGAPCGMSVGFVSGLGAPYQPFPAMIATLAMNAIAQGLMVACTGGLSPADGASGAMRYIATGTLIGDMPNAILVWALIGGMAALILTRTGFGRSVHAIVNREGAAYLPGAPAQRILVIAFAISGGLSALGGVLLAGYAGKTAQ